jgi:RNA polymerase sigma factor (sigma-70 family)
MSAEQQRNRIADFFRREKDRLVRYVRRLIDDAAEMDGEDILQDVMLSIFDRADITAPIQNVSAYVYRALSRRTVDRYRRRRRDLSLDAGADSEESRTLLDTLPDSRYGTTVQLERRELQTSLFEAIDSLRTEYQRVVVETEFEGKSFRELSEELGVPLNTLLSWKRRAVSKLRSALETPDNNGER